MDASDHQNLPIVPLNGKDQYLQIQGRIKKNTNTTDWGKKMNLSHLTNMLVTSERQQQGILVSCPTSDSGNVVDIHLSWNLLFFFPKSCFIQADIPFKVSFTDVFRNLEKLG
jgi:hypothetical protein